MYKLTAELPDSITIDGKEYSIDTDYRIMADFETKINRTDITDKKALAKILSETLSALFTEIPDVPAEKLIAGMLWYYRCGKDPEKSTKKNHIKCYDYDEDADHIFAAFMQQYGDDLTSSDMHWWKFRAKFTNLTDTTKFVRIMQYRCADLSLIKDRNERARIKKLQDIYALKSRRISHIPDTEARNDDMKKRLTKRFEEVKKLSDTAERKE